MTPTPDQVIAFKAALRKQSGNRCEAVWPEIIQWRDDTDGRCICREGNSPPCLQCEGRGVFDAETGDEGAIKLPSGQWIIPCQVCLSYGRDTGKPALALKFHRLRGQAGEINVNDVIMLCSWCSAAMTANPTLAASIKLETVRLKS